MRKTKRTSAEIFPLVGQYLQGDQSPPAFCAERGLPMSQLYYWRRKYRAKPQGEAFLEVIHPSGVRPRLVVLVSALFPDTVLQRKRAPA